MYQIQHETSSNSAVFGTLVFFLKIYISHLKAVMTSVFATRGAIEVSAVRSPGPFPHEVGIERVDLQGRIVFNADQRP